MGLNMPNGTILILSHDADQDEYGEKETNTRKRNAQESQGVSSFPAGDHNATRNTQDSTTKTNMKHKHQK